MLGTCLEDKYIKSVQCSTTTEPSSEYLTQNKKSSRGGIWTFIKVEEGCLVSVRVQFLKGDNVIVNADCKFIEGKLN